MAFTTFLQGLGATHLFTLDNVGTSVADDLGDSVAPTYITGGEYSFVEKPVCNGVTHSLKTTLVEDTTTRTDGATFANRLDINGEAGANDTSTFDWASTSRSVFLWFRIPVIDTPTCLFEQGGPDNNVAIILGIGGVITYQVALANEVFLIAHSKFKIETDRNYLVCATWEASKDGHGYTIGLTINRRLQETVQNPTVNPDFSNHGGDITIGNSAENLRTYNEGILSFAAREKYSNIFGICNGVVLTLEQASEIFERSVIPTVTISADTVANQQVALDALSGNIYTRKNCAIRIIQATDATDYRLFVDNISFDPDQETNDIDIQYVGPNTLTLENTNGSNMVEVSTPAQVDLDGTTILTGGGTINIVENTHRLYIIGIYQNITATKLVISASGDYSLSSINVDEIENVSGGEINVSCSDAIDIITPTDGIINFGVRGSIELKGLIDSSVYVVDENRSPISFVQNKTGIVKETILSTATGSWTWVVSRPGYEKISGTVASSKDFLQTIVYSQKLDFGNGLSAYGGMTSSNLSFSLVNNTIIGTLLGDVSAKFFFDQLETFLATQDGCSWLSNNPNALISRFGTDFAGQILIMPDNIVVRSTSSGTKKLSAFVITTERSFDRSVFGNVSINLYESSGEISKAVWEYTSTGVSGNMKQQLINAKSHALAANLQTKKVGGKT